MKYLAYIYIQDSCIEVFNIAQTTNSLSLNLTRDLVPFFSIFHLTFVDINIHNSQNLTVLKLGYIE